MLPLPKKEKKCSGTSRLMTYVVNKLMKFTPAELTRESYYGKRMHWVNVILHCTGPKVVNNFYLHNVVT